MRYTKSHEWIRVEGNTGVVGITEHAQSLLGDVVFVELPEAEATYEQSQSFGAVESVKAASDLYLPVSGKVIASNTELESNPGLVNSSPYSQGWITKISLSDASQVNSLMDAAQYDAFAKEDHH